MSTDPKAAALALLPELTSRPIPPRLRRHRLVQQALALVATVVLLSTLAIPLALARDSGISEQVTTPVTALETADRSAYETYAAAADQDVPTAPVVLSYHDIGPETGDGDYVVTPTDFESQMQMLDLAGYQSLTLEEFLAYRDGTFTPPARSFLLTFDDGTSGLWRYADPILERYDMSAVSFLITGSVGTHQPYYLTWPEVEEMARSGRWQFGSHTDALHYRTPVDADGTPGGALTHRLWDADDETGPHASPRETEQAFAERVASDLDRSIVAMTEHGLPAPTVFAYPFSELNDRATDREDQQVATSLIGERFEVAFVNAARQPAPVSRRAAAARTVERLEVFTGDTDRTLFDEVAAMTTLPVTALSLDSGSEDAGTHGSNTHGSGTRATASLVDRREWSTPARDEAPVRATSQGITPAPGTVGYVAAEWAPARTADWTEYTIAARATSLRGDGRTVGLSVRVGSAQPVRVRVSDHQAQVLDGTGDVLSVADLDPGDQHDIRVRVSGTTTTVEVDGATLAEVPVQRGSIATGGFALDWGAASSSAGHAVVTSLSVTPSGVATTP